MLFEDCEFANGVPNLPGSRFERCIFNTTDLRLVPAAWRCMDCFVVYEGKIYSFGLVGN